MSIYGKAFKTIRLIKDIRLEEAAEALGIDVRTLRDIETGKTDLISVRFDQMLQFYKVPYQIVFELASDESQIRNVLHTIKRDAVFNQGTNQEINLQIQALNTVVQELRERISLLEANDIFQKDVISKLMDNNANK